MPGSIQEPAFGDFIQSSLFTFHVGSERKEFVVHSKVVAATSKYFKTLVDGGMSESEARCAQLLDVDPEDFARYLEFAYRGDYSEPSWVHTDEIAVGNALTFDLPQPVEEASTKEIVMVVDPWNFGMIPKSQKKRTLSHLYPGIAPRKTLRSKLEARQYLPEGEPRTAVLIQFSPRPNTAPEQDFTPIFLAHAHLYTFSDMRFIEPFKNLALHKLHKTLMMFKLFPSRVGDVVELARYAYSNGNDRGINGIADDLRRLVVEYMVSGLSNFKKHTSFVNLLEGGGEFVSDFWLIFIQENHL